jgi:hypothetical protein
MFSSGQSGEEILQLRTARPIQHMFGTLSIDCQQESMSRGESAHLRKEEVTRNPKEERQATEKQADLATPSSFLGTNEQRDRIALKISLAETYARRM